MKYFGAAPVEVTLDIPANAKNMEIWFRGNVLERDPQNPTIGWQRNAWDSNFSKNYRFEW